VSVQFATSDETALGGSDYVWTSGTLTWTDGDTTDKTITMSIIDDAISYEGSESLRVTLSSPTGGAFLATSGSGVSIEDNDPVSSPAPVPPPASVSSTTSSSGGGGGALGWAQLLALAIVLVAMKRGDRAANSRL
jgi:hypothetical protein